MKDFSHNGIYIRFIIGSADDKDFEVSCRGRETHRLRVKDGVISYVGEPAPADVLEAYAAYCQAERDEYEAERQRRIAKDPEDAKFWLPFDEVRAKNAKR